MTPISRVPVLSPKLQRQLQTRHNNMMYWWPIAKKAGPGSHEERTWKNRVDLFFEDIEGSIFLLGYNRLDHTRAPKYRGETA